MQGWLCAQIAVNVAKYNAWSVAPCPSYTIPNPNRDEKRYINALSPLLEAASWPDARFIVD
jgi:cellulose 1,4-beta-cellobiosidase